MFLGFTIEVSMPQKQSGQSLTRKVIEKLLGEQTKVILGAVDEKLGLTDRKIDLLDKRMAMFEVRLEAVETRLDKMETRLNQKLDRLLTTLDKFLKRLTDLEDEFAIMKHDLNRVKQILKEKLGVNLL